MAVTAGNVDVGLTGAISKAPLGTAAPTTAVSVLDAAYVDTGALSPDGIALAMPGPGDTTPIKIWQGDLTVRTLRATSEELPALTFTMLETNKGTVETYFGVTVAQTATEGSFSYTGAAPVASVYTADILDGTKSKRFHIPRGMKAEVGDLVFKNDEAIGYEVTIECEYDATAGYYFRYWDTGLKTP